MGSKSGYPVLRGTSRPGVMKAWRGKEGFKEAQKIEKKIPVAKFKKLKLPKKKWTKKDDAFVIGSGIGVAATEKFGKKKEAQTYEQKATGGPVGGGRATHGYGKAFMKGGKV